MVGADCIISGYGTNPDHPNNKDLYDASTNRQVGIVSYGDGDCTSATPCIDCKVTDNLDYIEKIITLTTMRQSDSETFPSNDPQAATTQTTPKPYPQTNSQSNPQTNPTTTPLSPCAIVFNMLKPMLQRT